jgi:hypothetical protein
MLAAYHHHDVALQGLQPTTATHITTAASNI